MSKNNLYNFISIFSYILLLIKFPVLLIFDNSFDNLSNYFIVISFSIATNFITSDLLSYKEIDKGVNVNEIIFGVLFFIVSSSLIYISYSNLFFIFILFNISLLFNSISISILRQINIVYIIYLEILVSLFQIGSSILLAKIFNLDLGYSLLISTTIIYSLVFFSINLFKKVNFFFFKIHFQVKILSVNLYFDMLITQFERLLLSIYISRILAYINIISSLINGVKRLIFDDNNMDKAIKHGDFNFNKIALKYSVSFFFVNLFLLGLYQFKFLESGFFLNFIRNIKPGYKLEDFKYLYFISALYFGVNPMSFFVSHQFRNGKFNLINFLLYLPILCFLILFLFNRIKIDSNFLIILLTLSTLHFLLFFVFFSKKYYNLSSIAYFSIILNYNFGYISSLYYFF